MKTASGDREQPIYAFQLAVERIDAAKEANVSLPFVLTARAENYLWARPEISTTPFAVSARLLPTPVRMSSTPRVSPLSKLFVKSVQPSQSR